MYIYDPKTNLQIKVTNIKEALIQADEFRNYNDSNYTKYWKEVYQRLDKLAKNKIIEFLIHKGYEGTPVSKQNYRGDESALKSYHIFTYNELDIQAQQFSNIPN